MGTQRLPYVEKVVEIPEICMTWSTQKSGSLGMCETMMFVETCSIFDKDGNGTGITKKRARS